MTVETIIGSDGEERVQGFRTGDFETKDLSSEDIGRTTVGLAEAQKILDKYPTITRPNPLDPVVGAPQTRNVGGTSYNVVPPPKWGDLW